jgi:hypothetical protein
MPKKEKTVSFRIKKYLYDFLDTYVEDKPFDKTDVLTRLIENFFLEYQKTGKEVDKKFETEVIFLILDKRMKEFLDDFAKKCGCSTKEMVLDILKYFFMGYLAGEFTKTLPELEAKMKESFTSSHTAGKQPEQDISKK